MGWEDSEWHAENHFKYPGMSVGHTFTCNELTSKGMTLDLNVHTVLLVESQRHGKQQRRSLLLLLLFNSAATKPVIT